MLLKTSAFCFPALFNVRLCLNLSISHHMQRLEREIRGLGKKRRAPVTSLSSPILQRMGASHFSSSSQPRTVFPPNLFWGFCPHICGLSIWFRHTPLSTAAQFVVDLENLPLFDWRISAPVCSKHNLVWICMIYGVHMKPWMLNWCDSLAEDGLDPVLQVAI